MSKAKCTCVIYQRLAEIQLSERDRQLATYALRDADAIMDAVMWVKRNLESLGARLPKPGFKTKGAGA